MKMPRDKKDEFQSLFKGKQFTLADVEKFIEPYFTFDSHQAMARAKQSMARNLVKSFRDIEGVRECFSFIRSGETLYAFASEGIDYKTVKAIMEQLLAKEKGLVKARRKMKRKLIGMMGQQQQMNLFEAHQAGG